MSKQDDRSFFVRFSIASVATSGACIGSNPMEVVKTRMQLQGELAAKGIQKTYRNSFHAFYKICTHEGIRGIQRGLFAGMCYQTAMNGTRLALFEPFQKLMGATDPNSPSFPLKNAVAGAMSGTIGAIAGSPFFLVKARIQAASSSMNTNSQYTYRGMFDGLSKVYVSEGFFGLYRGVNGAIPRVAVGSATQLSTYASTKHIVSSICDLEDGILVHFLASLASGVVVTTAMNPFDVVSTRLYSQKVTNGKGALYNGVYDCFIKTFRAEGIKGLFKGWTAHYFRLGPHTILTFVLWEKAKSLAHDYGL